MATYCKAGDKPTVIYSFNGGKEKTYKSKVSPIDVEIVGLLEDDGSTNYNGEGFRLIVTALDGYTWIDGVVKDYRADRSTDYTTYSVIPCGSSEWITLATLSNDQNVVSTDPNVKCPPDSDECFIRVKYQGSVIFKDKGKKDCNFRVQCGNCPDGFIECPHPGYPGYCCIDCKGSAEKINTLAQKVEQYGGTM